MPYYWPLDEEKDTEATIQREIKEAAKTNKTVIVDEFNSPHVNGSKVTTEQGLERQFLNTLNNCFLEQLFLQYIKGEATLDLVQSNT